MIRETVFIKVEDIFQDLLDDDTIKLSEDSSNDTMESWDSLFHITLIASVEDEFKIRLTTDEIARARKVKVLIDTILQRVEKQ